MSRTTLTMITLFMIGGIIGWFAGYAYTSKNTATFSSSPVAGIGGGPPNATQDVDNPKVSDMRVSLQSLLRQHSTLSGEYLQKVIKGENGSALGLEMEKNTQLLAGILSGIYGGNIGNEFSDMWNVHMEAYEDYAKAAKSNNLRDKDRARTVLISMSSDLESYMDKLNQTSVDQVGDLMREHIGNTLSLIDAAAQKDDARVATLSSAGYEQMGEFADYLTQIIAEEKPDMFR